MRTPANRLKLATLALVLVTAGCVTARTKSLGGAGEYRAPSNEDLAEVSRGELFDNPLERARLAPAVRQMTGDAELIDWSDDSHFCSYFRSGAIEELRILKSFYVTPGEPVFVHAGHVRHDRPERGSYCVLRTRPIDRRDRALEREMRKELVEDRYAFGPGSRHPLLRVEGCLRDKEWTGLSSRESDSWVNFYGDEQDRVVELLDCYPSEEGRGRGQLTIGEMREILRGVIAF